MKVAVFSTQRYDRTFLQQANDALPRPHALTFFEAPLERETAALAAGFGAVCIFVNDHADAAVLQQLAHGGTRLLALRCTGFNNVDIDAAAAAGLRVVRVAEYSPHSVAEHAVALILALDRKIHRAYNRTRDANFALDGLMGFDLHGKTVGVIGTGKIGRVFGRIMAGFGCTVLGHDPCQSPDFIAQGGHYVALHELVARSDVISLHCPLTPDTHHVMDEALLGRIKHGALLVNTSRGGLVDTEAAIEALKTGRLGGLGIDVYEQEAGLFFRDLSSTIIPDDVIQRLTSFPNVIVTGHQAFFTREAMGTICATTMASISAFEAGLPLADEVLPPQNL
ncbi:2-hydroxyacid dehydrogenase [Aquincola sp. J276]|uniref:2-hydroxyacid dehydrogenase n=2 Tax=Aquincola TaxID=391952 RepID=UPI0021516269|nr:2-hydroxyacid dehydrogenase [Aquincola sp. J276]MCR5866526.1 2-hydroxyacid dehydrogenase [Aquincola sp. J276]